MLDFNDHDLVGEPMRIADCPTCGQPCQTFEVTIHVHNAEGGYGTCRTAYRPLDWQYKPFEPPMEASGG